MRYLLTAFAALAATFVLVAAADAATTVTLAPNNGSPSNSFTVSGTGFAANASVDVFFGATDIAVAASSASGAVSLTVQVPASAQPGLNWVTLDERRTHAAAQATYNVNTSWLQGGFGPSWRGFNPFEYTIGAANVAQLTQAWSQQVTQFTNGKPFVVYASFIYALDENGHVHAYTLGGKLIWTAAPGSGLTAMPPTPAAGGGLVYFAGVSGLISAYKYNCRADGGVCTPVWTRNIGTTIPSGATGGGLTLRNGLLYVPGSDGMIHVLNISTGVPGTSLSTNSAVGLTSAPAFADDGSAYVAQANNMSYVRPNGAVDDEGFAAGVRLSRPAVGNAAAYFTSSDGALYSDGAGWGGVVITPSGGPSCTDQPPPVYADSVVYAAGCQSLGAYDAGTGTQIWQIPLTTSSQGLAVANGVLYACIGQRLAGFDASFGGRLWAGGVCAGPPEIVNGIVLADSDVISAATLTGAQTTAMRHARPRRPDPRRLRPTIRVHRSIARHHPKH